MRTFPNFLGKVQLGGGGELVKRDVFGAERVTLAMDAGPGKSDELRSEDVALRLTYPGFPSAMRRRPKRPSGFGQTKSLSYDQLAARRLTKRRRISEAASDNGHWRLDMVVQSGDNSPHSK
jgi:hypothetical protein